MRTQIKPLQFNRVDGSILYMLEPFSDNLVISNLDLSVPFVKMKGIYLGYDGVLVGYDIKPPKNHVLYNNCLIVGSDFDNASPYAGLPGLQIYETNNGICIASTKITNFYDRINKPL